MSRLAAAAAALRRGSAPNNLSILAPCLWLCRRFVCRTQSVIIGFKRAECAPLSAARGHTCAPAPCDNLDQLAAFTLGILQHRPAQSSSLCVLGEWTFFIPVGFVIISAALYITPPPTTTSTPLHFILKSYSHLMLMLFKRSADCVDYWHGRPQPDFTTSNSLMTPGSQATFTDKSAMFSPH